MKDTVGGTTQLIASGLGLVCYTVGLVALSDGDGESGSIFLTAGLGLSFFSGIYNIVRSASYRKPYPKTASLIDPEAWNIAILSGKDGVEKVQLAYTMHF